MMNQRLREASADALEQCIGHALGKGSKVQAFLDSGLSEFDDAPRVLGPGFAACAVSMMGEAVHQATSCRVLLAVDAPKFGPVPYPTFVRVWFVEVRGVVKPIAVYLGHGHHFYVVVYKPDGSSVIVHTPGIENGGRIPLHLAINAPRYSMPMLAGFPAI